MGLAKSLKSVLSPVKSVIGGINDVLGTGVTTQDQIPLETPEQRAARLKLLEFTNTGKFGNFTAGSDLSLGLGDFNVTDAEQAGLSELEQLLASGIPEQYRMGDNALRDILNPDPNFIASQFDPFKTQVQRQTREATDSAKRNAAFAGNLYSTDTIRNLGDVEARGNETLTAQLAELTNAALNRRLQAVPLAFQSGKAQEDLRLGRVNASQVYGGLTRTLNDAAIKARDAEILRRRQELQLPIQAATNLSTNNANFGVPSVSVANENPFMDLLNIAAQAYAKKQGAGGGGGKT